MQQVVTLLSETGKYVLRQVFFLSNLLAFDTMLEVESPEGSDSYAFVGETPMEELVRILRVLPAHSSSVLGSVRN